MAAAEGAAAEVEEEEEESVLGPAVLVLVLGRVEEVEGAV